MNGLYTEHYVKRTPSPLQKIGKVAMIAVPVLLLLAGLMLASGILAFLGIAALIAAYFLMPMFNVDYEYIFVDGQIDFDRISGGEKRKNMLRIDLDNIEIMAPENSHRLDGYRNQQGLSIKDFTSNTEGPVRHCIFIAQNGEKMFIKLEPSEKIIEFSRQKAPRKVFTD
ncbi:MAG: hypothetical protein J6Y89_00120 [Lachnospiraceae bacterium]|nr:hypothetical protein [Lachnospiraceae bacterium]